MQVIIFILIVLLIIFLICWQLDHKKNITRNRESENKISNLEQELKTLYETRIALVDGQEKRISELLELRMTAFKENEMNVFKEIIRQQYENEYKNRQQTWEASIREDAIMRSRAVLSGKFIENVFPFSPDYDFLPGETRFIGEPIDLIVFEGSSDPGTLVTIHFLEIKTGKSKLSEKQIRVRDAVKNKRVEWREVKIERRETI